MNNMNFFLLQRNSDMNKIFSVSVGVTGIELFIFLTPVDGENGLN